MRLFIAEKPSLARAVARGLGIIKTTDGCITCKNDCVCVSCFGHLLQLAEPDYYLPADLPKTKKGTKVWRLEDLPIFPERWHKQVSPGKSRQIKIIKELLGKASEVVNTGDPDREGQLLVDEVIAWCGYKGPVLRYWATGTDETSVKRALAQIAPNSRYADWGQAAEARGRLDWLIGMNLSRAVTLNNNAFYSVGRVQTPVLRLVYDRDRAIADFKSEIFYNLTASFLSNGSAYKGVWRSEKKDLQSAKATAAKIKDRQGVIISLEQKNKRQLPPIPYNLTELQAECNRSFGFTVKKTLEIAQKLYEEYGLTSYPRSSCGYLPKSQQADAPRILSHLEKAFPGLKDFLKRADPDRESKVWNDAKVSEEAHTGIVPTLKAGDPAKLPEDCRKVYELIARRYIACFMPDCVYKETKITTEAAGELFDTEGKEITDPGFTVLTAKNKTDSQPLPALAKDAAADVTRTEIKEGKTKPPSPYTEASIVETMENVQKYIDDPKEKKLLKEGKGIGTAATRAEIIESLKRHGFITNDKGKLHCAPEGGKLLKVVPAGLQSASLTANIEEELSAIQQGKLSLADFINSKRDFIQTLITEIENMSELKKCPKCGQKLWHNKYDSGWSCFKCSSCGARFQDSNGEPGEEIQTAPKKQCPVCSKIALGRYQSKTGTGQFYWFCVACKTSFADNNGALGAQKAKGGGNETCPACGKKAAKRYPNKNNPEKFHWWCRECKTSFADDNGKIGKQFDN